MASEVDICNLALAHLGDEATVASLSPPEGSAQADHCARFYPIARDALLQMHPWGFASQEINLAVTTATRNRWAYCYAQPNDMLAARAIVPIFDAQALPAGCIPHSFEAVAAAISPAPQPFVCEADADGTLLICTNQPTAILRYTARVTDTTKFSPLFITTLSWYLASMLAGPLLKGDAGRAEAERCLTVMQQSLDKATESDANQEYGTPAHVVPWMRGR